MSSALDGLERTGARLVTSVALDPPGHPQAAHQIAVTALLELEVGGGRRVVLLDDRGWASSTHPGRDLWRSTTAEDVERTARVVVGPDEPRPGTTWDEGEAMYWETLSAVAERHGVAVTGPELAVLPHVVVLEPVLLERLARSSS